MYIKSYKTCKFCFRDFVSSRIKTHESKCLDQQEKSNIVKGPAGRPKGMSAWNKGLSKSTDDRVLKMSNSLSKTMKEKVETGEFVPRVMSELARKKLSESQSLHNRGGKCKWYVVSGVKVQGTWERDLAVKFDDIGISWIKPKTNNDLFKYTINGKERSYAPDFYLPEYDIYLEIKGYWWGNDKDKMRAVIEQNPSKKIVIIEKKDYYRLLQGELVW